MSPSSMEADTCSRSREWTRRFSVRSISLLKKAKTSVLFGSPSEALWEYCKPGGPAPATESTNGGLIPCAGGIPIRAADGSLIGAIGVSGGMPAQDAEVAKMGLASEGTA